MAIQTVVYSRGPTLPKIKVVPYISITSNGSNKMNINIHCYNSWLQLLCREAMYKAVRVTLTVTLLSNYLVNIQY